MGLIKSIQYSNLLLPFMKLLTLKNNCCHLLIYECLYVSHDNFRIACFWFIVPFLSSLGNWYMNIIFILGILFILGDTSVKE